MNSETTEQAEAENSGACDAAPGTDPELLRRLEESRDLLLITKAVQAVDVRDGAIVKAWNARLERVARGMDGGDLIEVRGVVAFSLLMEWLGVARREKQAAAVMFGDMDAEDVDALWDEALGRHFVVG